MSSSSSSRAEEREYRHSDGSSSSSGSDDDKESDRRIKKKARKEDKKKLKKESKTKKEKKEKKDKKEKREKRDRKDRKREKEPSSSSSSNHDSAPALSEHDAIEMSSFKEAVQGKQVLVANEREQASLLHASREDIAASLGLPKGLIRTTVDESSMTQRYSRELYGGDDDNPAKRQRLKREQVARRALEIARNTLSAKALAAATNTAKPTSSGLMDMMNRFSSSNKGTT